MTPERASEGGANGGIAGAARRVAGAAVRRAKPAVRAAWRRSVVGRGTDISRFAATRSCVVFAPHPDDETIGCGATIAKKRAAGTPVKVVVVGDGSSSHPTTSISAASLVAMRAREVTEACDILGVEVDGLVQWGYPDESFADHQDGLVNDIIAVLDGDRPDEVYVPSALDWHPDHQALNRAVREAIRGWGHPIRMLEYPVWFWADGPWAWRDGETDAGRGGRLLTDVVAAWRRYRAELVSTDGSVATKRRALTAYRSQRERPGDDLDWAVLDDAWFEPFLGAWEVFFPMAHVDQPAGAPLVRRSRVGRAPRVADPSALPTVRTVTDRFDDDRPSGEVIGSVGPAGALRRGADAEGRVGIDHGALRMAPLETPGFGRESLVYGPFDQRPGLTFAALVLNGHNTSRTDFREEGRRARARRLARELSQGRFDLVQPTIYDNLAVGWFDQELPTDPLSGSHALVMHAATVLNGELRVGVGDASLRVRQGIQNLPIAYVVVLREKGAAYYAGSLDGAAGLAAYPKLRPLGIDPRALGGSLFAGIHQSVLGEVDYRVSTRVSAVEVFDVAELASWCSTAMLADRFVGEGALDDGTAERGGRWSVREGVAHRTGSGLVSEDGFEALTPPVGPIGLLHLLVRTGPRPTPMSVTLRADDHGRGLRFTIGPSGVHLDHGGVEVASAEAWSLRPETEHSVQILDDGSVVSVHVDGALVFDRWIEVAEFLGSEHAAAGRVGLSVEGGGSLRLVDLEAHPREVDPPGGVDLGRLWAPLGGASTITDDFIGQEGDLAGTASASGDVRWHRRLGQGRFLRTGDGLRVDASVARPCPGRTLYTVRWDRPDFAEIEVEAVPPGSGRGEGENGRAGLVFWQDGGNYLVVNPWIDDYEHHDGSSISSFLTSRGHEDMYDAVWSNVGRNVRWGEPYRLRVAFDGARYLAWLGDEPVLFRSVTDIDPLAGRLRINEVGIATNWEWGDDTGSVFRRFTARPSG